MMNIRNTLIHFYEKTEFSPRHEVKEAVTIFIAWFIPSFIFVLFVECLSNYRSVEYFTQAITEGIGPNLWNVIGVFGFVLFGVAILFPGIPMLAYIANRVLINVYAIGSLMFGLLLGQSVSDISDSLLETWRLWLFGSVTAILFTTFIILNSLTWYLSFLIYEPRGKTSFVSNIEELGIWLRLCVGILVILLPSYLMFAER